MNNRRRRVKRLEREVDKYEYFMVLIYSKMFGGRA